MLQRFADDLWTVARAQRFWGVETGTRMALVRLSNGGLFVHCPVRLDPELKRAVDALGPVQAVVAPSLFHHLYVADWIAAYPDAEFCPCPGLEQKRSDLRWGEVLGERPRAAWASDLDQAAFTARFEHEIVFFHRKSRTLVCADALLNLSQHPSPVTRAVAFCMGNSAPGKGWMERVAVQNWKLGRGQVDRILQWDIDGITLAHGGLVERDGREIVREAYRWL